MGLGQLWAIGRARAGLREIEDRLIEFDRVIEDLRRQHGHAAAALEARYLGLRRWLANEGR